MTNLHADVARCSEEGKREAHVAGSGRETGNSWGAELGRKTGSVQAGTVLTNQQRRNAPVLPPAGVTT